MSNLFIGATKTIREPVSTDDASNPTVGSGQSFQKFTYANIEPTFANLTKTITNIVDYSATVAGTISITVASHGLTTGDTVTVSGTTSYDGSYSITTIDSNTFYVTATYVADETSGTLALTTPASTITCDLTMLLVKSDGTGYSPAVTTVISDDTPFKLEVDGNSDVNAKLDNISSTWRSITIKAFGVNK